MGRRTAIIRAIIILALVWGGVWSIRAYAGSRKITAELINRQVAEAKFQDWSNLTAAPDAAEAKRRESELRSIADNVNKLDFQEREKNRENRAGENFFRVLSPTEKAMFIDLTIVESMGRFMESLDAMKPEQRKSFVEKGLKEIQQGRTQEEMARADKLGAELLEKISQEGMRTYFKKSSADTKLDLAPLMEAMNETMQGLRGNEFGPRQ